LCDCGCNSFGLNVPDSASLEPLVPASAQGGCVLSLKYYVDNQPDPSRTVEVDVFVDARGFLAGIDVAYCSNSAPMPDAPALIEPPFHIHGRLVA